VKTFVLPSATSYTPFKPHWLLYVSRNLRKHFALFACDLVMIRTIIGDYFPKHRKKFGFVLQMQFVFRGVGVKFLTLLFR
jgi:hypothetical protein